MPKKQDAKEFKKILDKGVILVAGDGDVIDLEDSEPVRVAVMFDVNGFGPHVGAIYAMQRGHVDEALQAADELLEEWTLDHYPDSDQDHFTETFDGRSWTLSVEDFADAIEGTAAEKFIETTEDDGEEDEGVLEENDEDNAPPLIRISFTRITRGDSDDSDDYEEEHGWIDEEGVEFEPDEDDLEEGMSESESIVRQAVDFLEKEGASNPSSTAFHPGIWYSTEYQTTDYGTGEEEERSFHLKGFQPEEEAAIFKQVSRRR